MVQFSKEAPASNSKSVEVSEQSQEQGQCQNCRIQWTNRDLWSGTPQPNREVVGQDCTKGVCQEQPPPETVWYVPWRRWSLEMRGRLSNADISFEASHPVLLPRGHHLTTLVVRRAHQRVLHNGEKDTLTEVRGRYWIVKGRWFVMKVVRQCVICKRFEVRPFLGQSPPPLPNFRLCEDPLFTYTGVDFAQPLYVKGSHNADDSKVWICLYTCCVVRAVHLDVVPKLTTTVFIHSLKRFSARWGLPRQFVSDNGKTFKAAARLIDTIIHHQDVHHYLLGVGVRWLFNLERALWWSGVFERMVQMMKCCLKKTVGRAKFSYDELVTAVIEVEGIINSRPLTCVTADMWTEATEPSWWCLLSRHWGGIRSHI